MLSPWQFRSRDFVNEIREKGGASRSEITGEAPETGYMVSRFGAETTLSEGNPNQQTTDYRLEHREELTSHPSIFLGGWSPGDGRPPVLDISRRAQSMDEAQRVGRRHAQEAVYDVAADDVVPVNFGVGGDGRRQRIAATLDAGDSHGAEVHAQAIEHANRAWDRVQTWVRGGTVEQAKELHP